MKLFVQLLAAALLLHGASHRAIAGCACDCDGDGAVHVAELIRVTNIALGNREVSSCANLPEPCNACVGAVGVTGLIRCVNNALDGCPTPPPTPTREMETPTVTATPAPPTSSVTPIRVDPPSPTPTLGPGPDLIVASISTAHLSSSSCGPFEALYLCVANLGRTPSGDFNVELVGSGSFAVDKLAALEQRCLLRPLTRLDGSSFTAIVDPDNTVAEVNETNNMRTESVRWPTIRATCTAATRTRTPTRTQTPTKSQVPSHTPAQPLQRMRLRIDEPVQRALRRPGGRRAPTDR